MIISLRRPLRGGRVTQWFGSNEDWYKKFSLAGHNGVDYGVQIGTPVLAAISGTIVTFPVTQNGFGVYMKITDGKMEILYAHLSDVLVEYGQFVEVGQTIALSGNSGNSTGPHLHFGLRVNKMRNPAYNGYIDPVPFIEE